MNTKVLLSTALAALGLAAAQAAAAPQDVDAKSFYAATFIDDPAAQLTAVQAIVARTAPSGANAQSVLAALRQAGAVCTSDEPTSFRCVYTFLQHPTGNDIEDVSWRIRIDTGRDGTVAGGRVVRTIAGM